MCFPGSLPPGIYQCTGQHDADGRDQRAQGRSADTAQVSPQLKSKALAIFGNRMDLGRGSRGTLIELTELLQLTGDFVGVHAERTRVLQHEAAAKYPARQFLELLGLDRLEEPNAYLGLERDFLET